MHRELAKFGFIELMVIVGGILFVLFIAWIDWLRKELGYRVEPADYIGLNAPTTIQEAIAAEADKQQEQGGEPK